MSETQVESEQWKPVVYELCVRQAQSNGGNKSKFTKKQMNLHIKEIKRRTNFICDTPKNSLSYYLQKLRDEEKLSFLGKGVYRLATNEDGSLKYPLEEKTESKMSKGERVVYNTLKKYEERWGIKNIESEKTFDDLKDTSYLRLDFYFEIENKRFAIEFDGEQHFRPVDRFGGEEGFKKTRQRDAIKNQWCWDNEIRLLRIPYYNISRVEDSILALIRFPDHFLPREDRVRCDTCLMYVPDKHNCFTPCKAKDCQHGICYHCEYPARREKCTDCLAILCTICSYRSGRCEKCDDIFPIGEVISEDFSEVKDTPRKVEFCKVVKIDGAYYEDIEPNSIKVRCGGRDQYIVDFVDSSKTAHTYRGSLVEVAYFYNRMQINFNSGRMWMKAPSLNLEFRPDRKNEIKTSSGQYCTIYGDHGDFRPKLWTEGSLAYLKVRSNGSGSFLKTFVFPDINQRNAFLAEMMSKMDYDYRPPTLKMKTASLSNNF